MQDLCHSCISYTRDQKSATLSWLVKDFFLTLQAEK